jgi:shikimate dehydrogenase
LDTNEALDLKLYGVIGHPIGHSLSPLMHNTAFDELGIRASMQAFDIDPRTLREALQGFVNLEFGGFNVTIPHKETIIPLLDEIDEEASIIGAVNTVKIVQKRLFGYNTDARGFLQSLEPARSLIEGGKFVVLGAGGAARAIVFVLLKHFRTSQIVIASRSMARVNDLIDHFRGIRHTALSAFSLTDPQLLRIMEASDVIVNATPAGMYPNVKEMPVQDPPFRGGQLVVDLIYHPLRTELLRKASEASARTIGGLEMFLHQGAHAFNIWTGQTMNTESVRAAIVDRLFLE